MMDVDEFMLPRQTDSMLDVLNEFDVRADREQLGALGMYCQFYGGSRSKSLPEGLLPELYTLRDDGVELQGYEKLIVMPAHIDNRLNIHGLVHEKLLMLNETKAIFNHYWWQRPRSGSTVEDDELMRRFGERWRQRVPLASLRRSSLAKPQMFSLPARH
jgi:hypothetical protein